MSRAAAAFAAGFLGGGMKGYAAQKQWDREEERDKQIKEQHDLQMDAARRQAERDKAVDAAASEYAGMVDTGNVNVLPPGSDSKTMGPPAALAPEEGGGAPAAALQQLYRPATQADKLGALTKLASARGDVNAMATLGKQAEEAKFATEDMEYARRVATEPTGDDAKQLLGMLGKQTVGGVSMRTDPKTGLAFVDLATPGGEPRTIELSGTNLMRLAMARRKLERGDPSAIGDLAEIDKGLAAAAVADWKIKSEVATLNNNAVGKGASIANQAITTGLAVNADTRAGAAQDFNMQEAQRKQAEEQAAREAGAEVARAAGWSPQQVEAVRKGALKPPGATLSKDYSPDKVRADIYGKALAANLGDAKRAQEATESAMGYLFPAGTAAAPGATPPSVVRLPPPAAAVDMLRQNPALAAAFDQKYGNGAAAAALQKK